MVKGYHSFMVINHGYESHSIKDGYVGRMKSLVQKESRLCRCDGKLSMESVCIL